MTHQPTNQQSIINNWVCDQFLNTYLAMSDLFGISCSNEDVPVTKKVNDGSSLSLVNCATILAGNDTLISPVTFTIHLVYDTSNALLTIT